jgi:hypothetical protein
MRSQLTVVEVIPSHKMIVPCMESAIIVISHVMSMECESNSYGEQSPGR